MSTNGTRMSRQQYEHSCELKEKAKSLGFVELILDIRNATHMVTFVCPVCGSFISPDYFDVHKKHCDFVLGARLDEKGYL